MYNHYVCYNNCITCCYSSSQSLILLCWTLHQSGWSKLTTNTSHDVSQGPGQCQQISILHTGTLVWIEELHCEGIMHSLFYFVCSLGRAYGRVGQTNHSVLAGKAPGTGRTWRGRAGNSVPDNIVCTSLCVWSHPQLLSRNNDISIDTSITKDYITSC